MSKQGKVAKTYPPVPDVQKGGGPGSAGQSGDTQGLPYIPVAGSESVQELAEEGQYFEAEVLLAVETAEESDVEELEIPAIPDTTLPVANPGENSISRKRNGEGHVWPTSK